MRHRLLRWRNFASLRPLTADFGKSDYGPPATSRATFEDAQRVECVRFLHNDVLPIDKARCQSRKCEADQERDQNEAYLTIERLISRAGQ
jgi:hypothetical protein